MSNIKSSDEPVNSLIFLSDEPGDALIVEREKIVDEREEGSVTVGTHVTVTDCRTGEEREVDNYL